MTDRLGASPADTRPLGALRRFVGKAPEPAPEERCEMCAVVIAGAHAHVVSTESRSLMCVCRPCYLLFTASGAAGGKFRAVPERYRRLPEFVLSAAQWDELQIPVAMAFFFTNSAMGKVVAFYPSPAGAMESLLPLDAWRTLVDANPLLATLEADVEALLVRAPRGGAFECFTVPIDACYELTGLVRLHWHGFAGGEDAAREIDGFFARLRERGDEVGAGGAT